MQSGTSSHGQKHTVTLSPVPGEATGTPASSQGHNTNSMIGYISKYTIQFKPKESIDVFNIEDIVGNILQNIQDVDWKAALISGTDPSAPSITTVDQIPTDELQMQKYIEDPRTSSTGEHGKLTFRLTFNTSIPFANIKKNHRFAAWIRRVGLFFDLSELNATRVKYLGFFDKNLPHSTRIPFFTSLLRKTVKISKPFQILSQQVQAGEDSAVQSYAYIMVASADDEAIFLREMQYFRCVHTNFYEWDKFKDIKQTPLAYRDLILSTMLLYSRSNMSFVLSGFHENNFMLLQMKKKSNDSETTSNNSNRYAALSDDHDDDDVMDENTRLRIVTANVITDDLDDTLKDVNIYWTLSRNILSIIFKNVFFIKFTVRPIIKSSFTLIKRNINRYKQLRKLSFQP